MRRVIVTLASGLSALAATTSADAVTMSAPAALRAAIDDAAIREQVHCVPGIVHWHPWGWGTGCYYGYYYGPRVYGGYYGYYGPGYWGPRPRIAPRVYARPYRRW